MADELGPNEVGGHRAWRFTPRFVNAAGAVWLDGLGMIESPEGHLLRHRWYTVQPSFASSTARAFRLPLLASCR